MKNTLSCLVQNRLGALDRILNALTHRGFLPEEFASSVDTENGYLQVRVTFECEEEKTVEKLVKYLQNQVYVLEVRNLLKSSQEALQAYMSPPSRLAPLYLQRPLNTERKASYANHG